jgi:hypothetical protein
MQDIEKYIDKIEEELAMRIREYFKMLFKHEEKKEILEALRSFGPSRIAPEFMDINLAERARKRLNVFISNINLFER